MDGPAGSVPPVLLGKIVTVVLRDGTVGETIIRGLSQLGFGPDGCLMFFDEAGVIKRMFGREAWATVTVEEDVDNPRGRLTVVKGGVLKQ